MEYPKPMYKADSPAPKYVNSFKEERDAKDQGWSVNYIHRDWPKAAYDAAGKMQLVGSEEEAAELGLSFTKPEAVEAAPAALAAVAQQSTENTNILQSLIDGLERRISELEVKLADLEAAADKKTSRKAKESAA